MSWQDITLSGGTVFLMIALVPSLWSDEKPAIATSLMTGSVLTVFAAVDVTLSLWFTGVAASLTAALWFVLAIQQHRRHKAA